MKWSFSDGTVVHLGGNVEGTSALADKLRYDAKKARAGYPRGVYTLPPPGSERLNLDDPWHIDCWARGEARHEKAFVVEAPKVTPNPEWDEPPNPELGPNPIH